MKIFERFVANPRTYEEPLEDWSAAYGPTLSRVVKDCHTTSEASDAVWQWMRVRAMEHPTSEMEQPKILSLIRGDCKDFSVAFTGLARTEGLPVRTSLDILANDWQRSLLERSMERRRKAVARF